MKVRATILASALLAGAAFAADNGERSLIDAAKQGDRAAVQALVNGGKNANLAQADGTTALFWAASRNDAQMVDILLRARADVNAANDYGATALYVAAENADAAIVTKLLDAKADPNKALLSGETPLMQAARRGKLEVVGLLLARGANPNAKEINGGQTALMWAVSQRHSAVADALIKSKADVQAKSNSGSTALMFAAQQGDAESTRLLLAADANPNEVMPQSGFTPLIIASAMGHEAVVVQLLEKGAQTDAVDRRGFSSLHRAARDKNAVGIVRALLKHGANPNLRLNQARTASDTEYGSPLRQTLSAIAVTDTGIALQGATPLLFAAEVNNFDAVVALTEGGADPLIATAQNTTPLIMAAGGGTDLARPRPPEERATAAKTVAFLVEKGADVNAAGQFGWTALHAAAYQGLDDVIAYLAGKGAKLDTMDRFGQTPLSIAYAVLTEGIGAAYYQTPRIYRQETADLLLKLGATPLERSGVKGRLQQERK
jgi:serine/threonine-protein phosphatase 6 regulatory ankyrin repeat subunit B